jgi:flavin reductase (DIM6/NTAB) family NADH-FMN oxidoreductase RutF
MTDAVEPRARIRAVTSLPDEFDVPLTIGAGLSGGTQFDDLPDNEALDIGELEGDPALAFRRTLGMFATGVTVLTTRQGGQVHGMTANAFMSVSLTPPLVLISLDRRARLCSMLHESSRFGVSVLADGQSGLSDRFAGRVVDDVPDPGFFVVHETPLVDGALAHLVARVVRSYWGGDHSLFLGHVEYARYGEGRPLLFHGGRYERIVEDPRVFTQLPTELLEPMMARGEERRYDDGELLMQLGERADALFLILEGHIRVERPGRLTRMGPGDVVGEVEVLSGGPRTASIFAEGPVRALRLPREALIVALEDDSRAAMALIEVLASRFRETT